MLIEKQDCKMETDLGATRAYYASNPLCDCSCCRSLYLQIKNSFPLLDSYLAELGIDSARPDEAGSDEAEGYIDYLFISYTVSGKIIEDGKTDVELFDGGCRIRIVFGDAFVPNGQKGDYFVVGVYGVKLPQLFPKPTEEPAPEEPAAKKRGLFKRLLSRKKKI